MSARRRPVCPDQAVVLIGVELDPSLVAGPVSAEAVAIRDEVDAALIVFQGMVLAQVQRGGVRSVGAEGIAVMRRRLLESLVRHGVRPEGWETAFMAPLPGEER